MALTTVKVVKFGAKNPVFLMVVLAKIIIIEITRRLSRSRTRPSRGTLFQYSKRPHSGAGPTPAPNDVGAVLKLSMSC
jgi:hypothetical protein